MKDLCNEDLKSLKKEIKTLGNGKTFQTYELLELMVWKLPLHQKVLRDLFQFQEKSPSPLQRNRRKKKLT